jgi:hypothetical protein
MGRAAELLGVSMYDMMQYIGATMPQEHYGSIMERVALARRLLK